MQHYILIFSLSRVFNFLKHYVVALNTGWPNGREFQASAASPLMPSNVNTDFVHVMY